MKIAGKQSIIFYLTIFLLASPLVADTEEVLYTTKYEGKHSGITIKTTRSLVRTADNNYLFVSVAKALFASIEEISEFKLQDGKLVPESYQYRRSIFGAKKEEDVIFDWKNDTATYQEDGKPERTTVHEAYIGLLDPSLYQLQLQRDLLSGETNLDYDFVREKRIKNYRFKVVGKDEMKVGDEIFETVKIERISDDDKKTVIWLIPEFHYQMGKIQHTDEDGNQHEMSIVSHSSDPALFADILRSEDQSSASPPGESIPDRPAE